MRIISQDSQFFNIYFVSRLENGGSEDNDDSFHDLNESDVRSRTPDSGSEMAFEYEAFNPPLYKQRYAQVLDILQDERYY